MLERLRAMATLRIKTADQLVRELLRVVDRHESDAAAARALGISRSHLSRLLSGEKPMTAKIAHCLGYAEEKRYIPYEYRR